LHAATTSAATKEAVGTIRLIMISDWTRRMLAATDYASKDVGASSTPARLSKPLYTLTPDAVYRGVMPLNIKNAEVERLATEVARLTGESKTEAIRRALEERRRRLKSQSLQGRRARVLRFLEQRVWKTLPKSETGRRLSRREEDAILGYGPGGV
jgi:antitoxin VapB